MQFHEPGARPRHLCSAGLDASVDAFFAERWHDRNDIIRRGRVLAASGVDVQTEWMLFRPDEYRRDPFHQEFLRPHGFAWFAGMFLAQTQASALTLSPQRRLSDEPFSRAEIDAIALTMPHLRRAGALALAVGQARSDASLDMLARLNLPAFLLDRSGRVCRTNELASEVLGAGLDITRGHLVATSQPAAAVLRRFVHRLTTPGGDNPNNPVMVPRAFGQPLVVSGIPLIATAQDMFSSGVAVITVIDPDRRHAETEQVLRQAFGLTRAEAATARALLDGLELNAIAVQRGVGRETIRSQAKSVGAKTGARTRGKLVGLLTRILDATPRR